MTALIASMRAPKLEANPLPVVKSVASKTFTQVQFAEAVQPAEHVPRQSSGVSTPPEPAVQFAVSLALASTQRLRATNKVFVPNCAIPEKDFSQGCKVSDLSYTRVDVVPVRAQLVDPTPPKSVALSGSV